MKNENYITIQGWMVNELGLSGNELLIYSLIYGFSQDGQSKFIGSLKYIESCVNATRPTVIKTLKSLSEKGFLKIEKHNIGGHLFNEYMALNNLKGSKETLLGGSKETLPNNNNIDNTIKEKNVKKEKFDFRSEMIENGFDENLVDDWIKVRKTKKATNSKTALSGFIKQVEKKGYDKNYILRICVEKSWSGFNADWDIGKEPSMSNENKLKVGDIDPVSGRPILFFTDDGRPVIQGNTQAPTHYNK